MPSKTLFRGMIAIFLWSGGMVAMPAIANPKPQAPPLLVAQPSGQLTEENIRQVLTEIESALTKKNIEDVLKFVAPFVYSEVTVESNDRTLVTRLEGKAELRDLLKEIFTRTRESKVMERQTKIKITSDGQLGIATITTVKEIATLDKKRYFESSTDTIRFAWLDNQPTIVAVTIKGWLAERPAQ
jgi:hypothetical protein